LKSPTRGVLWRLEVTSIVFDRGSLPDPGGELTTFPLTVLPPTRLGWIISPHSYPFDAFSVVVLAARTRRRGASISCFLGVRTIAPGHSPHGQPPPRGVNVLPSASWHRVLATPLSTMITSRTLPADDVSEPSSKERSNHASRYKESSRQRPGHLDRGLRHGAIAFNVRLVVERLYQLSINPTTCTIDRSNALRIIALCILTNTGES